LFSRDVCHEALASSLSEWARGIAFPEFHLKIFPVGPDKSGR
jgi:hypothetical protein